MLNKTNKPETISTSELAQASSIDTIEKGISDETALPNELYIQIETLPAESIEDETRLVEITDNKLLGQVNNWLTGVFQAGNSVNNVAQIVKTGPVYRSIVPAGTKLANSKAMDGAYRGIFHGANGIKGQANLVKVESGTAIATNSISAMMNVSSLIVGQYYMKQSHAELDIISDGIEQMQSFQDNEYRSRVFSLVTHVKKIANFQSEILENEELRISKIHQLDSLEVECTQLLGQANLTLAGFAYKNKLSYEEYEKIVHKVQKWLVYQKSLLEILYKISDLRYTLHIGTVSREQCATLIPTYKKQVIDTQKRINSWHNNSAKRLGININEVRRKREGLDGAIHFIPSLLNDDYKFRPINMKTANMITEQVKNREERYVAYTSELYNEDVQLISKDGRLYYLPE